MRNRVHNLKSQVSAEFLTLHLNDIDRMKKEHVSIAKRFFKRQMQQTKQILAFHLHVLKIFVNKNDSGPKTDDT